MFPQVYVHPEVDALFRTDINSREQPNPLHLIHHQSSVPSGHSRETLYRYVLKVAYGSVQSVRRHVPPYKAILSIRWYVIQ